MSTRITHLAEERCQRYSGLSYLVPPWGTLARATCLIESVPGCCQVRILGGLARVRLVKPDQVFPGLLNVCHRLLVLARVNWWRGILSPD